MRSGIIITFPKGKEPVAEFFPSYRQALDESRKLRDAGEVAHELWSSDGGLMRKTRVGPSCVNHDASKRVMSAEQRQTWAAGEKTRQAAEANGVVATRQELAEKNRLAQLQAQDAADEAAERQLETSIAAAKGGGSPGVNFDASRPVLTEKQKAKRDARKNRLNPPLAKPSPNGSEATEQSQSQETEPAK